eukprot:2339312-Alexandrium_andersonii.AAC.1
MRSAGSGAGRGARPPCVATRGEVCGDTTDAHQSQASKMARPSGREGLSGGAEPLGRRMLTRLLVSTPTKGGTSRTIPRTGSIVNHAARWTWPLGANLEPNLGLPDSSMHTVPPPPARRSERSSPAKAASAAEETDGRQGSGLRRSRKPPHDRPAKREARECAAGGGAGQASGSGRSGKGAGKKKGGWKGGNKQWWPKSNSKGWNGGRSYWNP